MIKLSTKILCLLLFSLSVIASEPKSELLGVWEGRVSPKFDELGVFGGELIPIRIHITESQIEGALLLGDSWVGFTHPETRYSGNGKTLQANVENYSEEWSENYSIHIHLTSDNSAEIFLLKTANNYSLPETDNRRSWFFLGVGALERL